MSNSSVSLRKAYLDLLKRSLTDSIHQRTFSAVPRGDGKVELVAADGREHEKRLEGSDWPALGETMVGLKRLDNIEHLIETIIHEQVPGDLIEAGVWRGGAAIFMKGVLRAWGINERAVWLADSFAGLPAPDATRYPADKDEFLHTIPFLSVSEEEVRENFQRYGLLDDEVRFLKGWFKDTLPTLNEQQWSLIRLDGDLYESTMDGLLNLYQNVSPGGYVIIDDYGCLPCCKQAVDDFRLHHQIMEPLIEIDWTGIYWRKT